MGKKQNKKDHGPANVVVAKTAARDCSWCYTDPSTAQPPFTATDWEDWKAGICPRCKGKLQKNAVEVNGVVYDSYDDYWNEKHGPWPPSANQPKTTVGFTYVGSCGHQGDPITVGEGVTLYGFSHSYSSKNSICKTRTGVELDLFVALHDGWCKQQDVMMSPGLGDFKPTPVKPTMIWINTPDYDVPYSLQNLLDAARYVVKAARAGKKVGVGCMGGHGRTGMFMTTCAMLAGGVESKKEALKLVMKNYCKQVKESETQQEMLQALWDLVIKPDDDSKIPEVLVAVAEARKARAKALSAKSYQWPGVADQGPAPAEVRIKDKDKMPANVPPSILEAAGQIVKVVRWNGSQAGSVLAEISGKQQVVFAAEYDKLELPKSALPDKVRIKAWVKDAKNVPQPIKDSAGKIVSVDGMSTHAQDAVLVRIGNVVHVLYATEYEPVNDEPSKNVKVKDDKLVVSIPLGLPDESSASRGKSIVIDMATGQVMTPGTEWE